MENTTLETSEPILDQETIRNETLTQEAYRSVPIEQLKHEAYQSVMMTVLVFLLVIRFIYDALR
ncbi:MAG: hypothetical protein Q4A75_04340 [Peptostreptococcaceae bacterium]|nr:hypothetical protein [Peptostreptococcaceae bacterium]